LIALAILSVGTFAFLAFSHASNSAGFLSGSHHFCAASAISFA